MTEIDLLALHGLAVKRAGSPAAVAAVLGADEAEVESALEAAVAAGRAAGAKGTFMVAPAGREWLDRRYPEAYAELREDPAAGAAYERFERINRELLALFTDWQMMPAAGGERVPNDHTDADYDNGVVDRLGAQHERAEKVLDRFAELDPRLGIYRTRLDQAYDKVLAGETDWVSGARVDSYHTVWFELHEDLLRMLGREREEAP
jgi:phosphoglycolate phosphatase-like HAD superfamily hydrolase